MQTNSKKSDLGFVLEAIHDQIILNEMKQGEFYPLNEIKKKIDQRWAMDTSKTLINHACHLLEIQGFMICRGGLSSHQVRALDIQDVKKMLCIRHTLDHLVAMSIVADARKWDREKLDSSGDRMRQIVAKFKEDLPDEEIRNTRLEFIKEDVGFHLDLAIMANLDTIIPILRTSHAYPDTFNAASMLDDMKHHKPRVIKRLGQVVKQHENITRAIAGAIKSGAKSERVKIAVRRHLEGTLKGWFTMGREKKSMIDINEIILV